MSSERSTEARSIVAVFLVLLAALSAVSREVLGLGLLADDYGFLWPMVAGKGDSFRQYVLAPGAVNPTFWRPFNNLTFWLEYRLFGLEATGYRLLNLGYYALALSFSGRCLLWWGVPWRVVAGTLALCVLHPFAVIPQVWLSGRSDLLCLLGVAGALAAGTALLREPRWALAVAFAGFAAVGMLSKENGYLLPLYLCGLLWQARDVAQRRRVAVLVLTSTAMLAPLVGYRLLAWSGGLSGYGPQHWSAWGKAPLALAFAVGTSVFGSLPRADLTGIAVLSAVTVLLAIRARAVSPTLLWMALTSTLPYLTMLSFGSARYLTFSLPWLIGAVLVGWFRGVRETDQPWLALRVCVVLVCAGLLQVEASAVRSLMLRTDQSLRRLIPEIRDIIAVTGPERTRVYASASCTFEDPRTRLTFDPDLRSIERDLLFARQQPGYLWELGNVRWRAPEGLSGREVTLLCLGSACWQEEWMDRAGRFFLRAEQQNPEGLLLGVVAAEAGQLLVLRGWVTLAQPPTSASASALSLTLRNRLSGASLTATPQINSEAVNSPAYELETMRGVVRREAAQVVPIEWAFPLDTSPALLGDWILPEIEGLGEVLVTAISVEHADRQINHQP